VGRFEHPLPVYNSIHLEGSGRTADMVVAADIAADMVAGCRPEIGSRSTPYKEVVERLDSVFSKSLFLL
jgi:hypothetical protein